MKKIFLALVFLIGCGKVKMEPIKVGYLPMVSSLTHFVALEKGYYAEHGIRVDGHPIKTSNLIAQDLVLGHIDVAIELSVVPLLKQLDSAPGSAKIFSASLITAQNGFDAVLAKGNDKLNGLADLSKKRVGVFPGSTAKNTLAYFFKKTYPDLTPPIFVELDPALHLQALEKGDVDALHAYEPNLTTGLVKFGFKKISDSIYGLAYTPNPIGVAGINMAWSRQHPAEAKAMMEALSQAVAFISGHPEEARRILQKATGMDEKAALASNIMQMSPSKNIDQKNFDGFMELLKTMGEISQVPASAELLLLN